MNGPLNVKFKELNISWVPKEPHNANNALITLIIKQQMHYIKFHIKTLKIAPTCFDPKTILRELRCSLLKSF